MVNGQRSTDTDTGHTYMDGAREEGGKVGRWGSGIVDKWVPRIEDVQPGS